MNIIIKSFPYTTEKSLGGLFIGLSVAEQGITTNVIFVEDGLQNLFPSQNPNHSINHPSISDIIQQLYGMVKFYAIPSKNSVNPDILSLNSQKKIVPGIKAISYDQLVEMIVSDAQNPIVL